MSDQNLQTHQEIINKKRTAWGNLGVSVHHTELALQVYSQEILAKIPVDTEIEIAKIPEAEEALRLAKQNRVQLEDDRKKITGRLDDLIFRLMKPEKDVTAGIVSYSHILLAAKKKKEQQDLDNQKKADELKSIAQKVRIYVADINAAFLTEHAKLISDSYVVALEGHEKLPGGIPPENIPVYLEKIKARVTLEKRTIKPPVIKAVHNTQEDVDKEILAAFKPLPAQQYIDDFTADLDLKYSDYELAWKNKEQAIELNKKEAAENESAIEQQQKQDTVAATVQAMVTTPTVGYTSAALKKVYKLKMPETLASAKIIIMAYLSNGDKCDSKLRISKWFSGFGVAQMITALEKVKNDDEKFTFTDLVWEIEEKL